LRSSFLMADATEAEDFAPLAHNVKNLIETWQDLSVSHKEARALTKRLEKFCSPDNEHAHFASKLSTVLRLRATISPTTFIRVTTPGREFIGSGSFGEVYRGMWNEQTVAVKIFHPMRSQIFQSGNDKIIEDSVKSFTREFRAWNTVSGKPRLWPLHGFSISIDVDFEDVRLLLVSPLAIRDLTKISRETLCNKDQIVTFILDIALGLKNLHDFDIIHGDIRASNVLCCSEGHCYLTDFGIAKMPAKSTLGTFAKMVHGGWAAPELDQQPRSKQSDIFSFASTIYEMFTRRPPYEGDSTANDRSRPPRRTGRLNREEWNKLWEVLVVCWSADPVDRPTASELEASLRKVLQPLSE